MLAILDERQANVGPCDNVQKVERVPPWHVGVLAAMKDSDRNIEPEGSLAEEMMVSVLDDRLRDRIRAVAISRGAIEDAIAFDGGARLWR